jgi:flagellar hook assembly protein FlgD
MPVTAVDPSASGAGLRLSASPNPARGSVTLAVGSQRSGQQELTVRDVLGRSVRVLTRSWQAAGSRTLAWDGNDDSGSRVAPGVYLVTLRVGSHQTQSRVTLLY